MPWSTRFIYCINAVCALFSMSRPVVGRAFMPRDTTASAAIARRVCVPATPDVSKSSIIVDVCNQAPANESFACSDQMAGYIQQSVTESCGQYFRLFADCLVSNDVNPAACSDSLYGYQDCSNYTMQAYAYCGCYYTVPSSLADCANEQLQNEAQDTATFATTSAPATNIPTDSDVVPSAASADREATPAVLSLNEESASLSSQNTTPFPYPQMPNAPAVATTSQSQPTPSSVPDTPLAPNVAPNTTSDSPTMIKPHTTTSTAAAYTTTLNPPPSTITVYTCPLNANDEPLPTPSVPASTINADILAPHSIFPALPNTAAAPIDIANASTRGSIAPQEPSATINEIQTSQPGAQEPSPFPSSSSITAPFSNPGYSSEIYQSPPPSTSPSTFPPQPLNTATPSAPYVPFEAGPAGGNSSALCGGCKRRRSKILRS